MQLRGRQGADPPEACDYNGDGDVDLYAGRYDPDSGIYRHYLLKNEWGIYRMWLLESGITHQGEETAVPALPIMITMASWIFTWSRKGPISCTGAHGEETFTDVGGQARVDDPASARGSLFFDYDHDGDLDIFVSRIGKQPAVQEQYGRHLPGAGCKVGSGRRR